MSETILCLDPRACTVAGLFRTDSLQGDGVTLVSDYNSSGWDTRFVFHVSQYIDCRLHATIRKQHLSEWDCASNYPVPLREWHSFAFTVSKFSGVCRLYLDCELQQELAIETDVDYIENVPVHLGKSIFQASTTCSTPAIWTRCASSSANFSPTRSPTSSLARIRPVERRSTNCTRTPSIPVVATCTAS